MQFSLSHPTVDYLSPRIVIKGQYWPDANTATKSSVNMLNLPSKETVLPSGSKPGRESDFEWLLLTALYQDLLSLSVTCLHGKIQTTKEEKGRGFIRSHKRLYSLLPNVAHPVPYFQRPISTQSWASFRGGKRVELFFWVVFRRVRIWRRLSRIGANDATRYLHAPSLAERTICTNAWFPYVIWPSYLWSPLYPCYT